MSGIVTLHDLIETLVGDLEEEEVPPKPEDIEKINENIWKIQGYTDLSDVAEALDIELPTETYDTFSGMICGAIGRVPAEGENFTCEIYGMKIEVKDVKNHMIKYAVVQKLEKEEDEAEAEQE